jgi:hypothetical protein
MSEDDALNDALRKMLARMRESHRAIERELRWCRPPPIWDLDFYEEIKRCCGDNILIKGDDMYWIAE